MSSHLISMQLRGNIAIELLTLHKPLHKYLSVININ